MGGEKAPQGQRLNLILGSPPRGRGKVPVSVFLALFTGITPAWAGKRQGNSKDTEVFGDHPRVGGEKFGAYTKIWNEWGSPPRGRGKVFVSLPARCIPGITPAWAGKSDGRNCRCDKCEDHPRVGGEKRLQDLCGIAVTGSPPRGRGKVQPGNTLVFRFRITPAWAGKRSSHAHQTVYIEDHPRVGGEKFCF